jgi:hypothetical protein
MVGGVGVQAVTMVVAADILLSVPAKRSHALIS